MKKNLQHLADWMINHYVITTSDLIPQEDCTDLYDMICMYFEKDIKTISDDDLREMTNYIFTEYKESFPNQELLNVIDNLSTIVKDFSEVRE